MSMGLEDLGIRRDETKSHSLIYGLEGQRSIIPKDRASFNEIETIHGMNGVFRDTLQLFSLHCAMLLPQNT